MKQSERPSDNIAVILYRLGQIENMVLQLQEDHNALEKGFQSHGTILTRLEVLLDEILGRNGANVDTRIANLLGSFQEINRRVLNLENDATILKQMLSSLVEAMAHERVITEEADPAPEDDERDDDDSKVKIEWIRARYALFGAVATIVGGLLTLVVNALLNPK